MTRDVRVLAVAEEGRPIAFAQLERAGSGAEITQVYVHPDHRGGGRGTAMTRAAIDPPGDGRGPVDRRRRRGSAEGALRAGSASVPPGR